jgi:hypothetical protein
MTAVSWPRTLEIPAAAEPQWRALSQALEDREPPCAASPELWFSRRDDQTEAAIHRCHTCPAIARCDEYATAANEIVGVWAGRDRGLRPTRRGTK